MPLTKKNLNPNKKIETIIDIDELHKKAISMLKDVKKVLDKYRLVYWIEDGTLLGYMRNKKIISWDDEIDLGTYASKFPKIKDICNELNKKGYISKFAFDRLKIWKKDWKMGYINIDLHLWRLVNGHYVCDYHEEKKSIFSIFFRNMERLERLLSCFNYKNKVEYYRFKNIAQVLLSNNINPKDWKNIRFVKGPYNRQESFILKNPKFYIVSDPIKNVISSHFIYTIIKGLFKILPKTLIGKLHNTLNKLYKLKRYDYSLLKIPKHYFEHLSTINFYGIKFRIPKKSKGYLKDMYGDNWRIPNTGWKRKDMGVISKQNTVNSIKGSINNSQ
ncbi:MAG: LicD family protein [Nanoarchaeota archaeon]|nr:LicD family protein [Nanoarchaeota archaeon]